MSNISQRKQDHLKLCISGEVDFRHKTTLLEQVQLVPEALPNLCTQDIDLTTNFLGHTLKAPLFISGMTGGTESSFLINHDLATAAEALGIGFGLGSQRALLRNKSLKSTYQVRSAAPTSLILANIGITQARDLSGAELDDLAGMVSAQALCIHLNAAMELVQPEGDRDFRDGLATIEKACRDSKVPILVKETGCGISSSTALRLKNAGARAIDVGGAGGTSWVGVETLRSLDPKVGDELWDWGIPTAAAVAMVAPVGLPVIASGGIRTGLDVANALALGATAVGLAAPLLKAQQEGGHEAVITYLQHLIDVLKCVLLLTGCKSPRELASRPKLIGATLQQWLDLRV